MKVVYDPKLKAQLSMDEAGRVRSISQSETHESPEQGDAVAAAVGYLRRVSAAMDVNENELSNAEEPVSFLSPEDRGAEYRLSEVKERFGSTTVSFYQTYLNLPVWRAGVSVTVKQDPNRVTGALNSSQVGLEATLPQEERINHYRVLFDDAAAAEAGKSPAERAAEGAAFVRGLVAGGPDPAFDDKAQLIQGRFFVYRYEAGQRLPPAKAAGEPVEPVLPLDPVPPQLEDGKYYVVAEVTFRYATAEFGRLNWLALVELETGAVLYLRALVSQVDGRVFTRDPITQSGDATRTSNLSNADLNPFRSWQTLPRLGPASASGQQALTGDFVRLTNVETPTVTAPTAPAATGFDYDVRTNDFAAVNAYYHSDEFFAELESLGFDRATYFGGTTFPIEIDHRGMGNAYGNTINAHCVGNGTGGIEHVCYALGDTTDTTHPVGRACDSRVTWHELGGHGVLYDHVNWPNFGFSHSAGDSLSAIRHDPDTNAPDRFRYAPWNPVSTRRFDRDPGAGWNWGGPNDDSQYGSEEILATTMFRVYRSIGGDSTDINTRWFASRMMQWLILHTIETFTEATNPGTAEEFAETMIRADEDNWTTFGLDGPAYGKVVRWSFEKQGLYGGQPPEVDVYIEDGRHGEYGYKAIHWENPSIWNRQAPDGGLTHEPAREGITNFAYVKIKNRGQLPAQNVSVRGYHCKPSAGVLWPNDLQPMDVPELPAGTLGERDTEEKIVGPFEWTPVANAWGHDCMFMIVTAEGDESNVSKLCAGEKIEDWRLVPNDNNIGQRNVVLISGASPETLLDALDGLTFWVRNPRDLEAKVVVRVQLPNVLSSRGWRLVVEGAARNKLVLSPLEEREVVLRVIKGTPFDGAQLIKARARTARVVAYMDGIATGGMTYVYDPKLALP